MPVSQISQQFMQQISDAHQRMEEIEQTTRHGFDMDAWQNLKQLQRDTEKALNVSLKTNRQDFTMMRPESKGLDSQIMKQIRDPKDLDWLEQRMVGSRKDEKDE